MASPRVSAKVPFYDPSKSSLAYGDRALPKLNRELKSEELRVRQQALLLLADVLHRREHLASAITEGILATLKELLKDPDPIVRERTTKVLRNIAQHSLAREAFLQLNMILALSKLFDDSEYLVRMNAHSAVEMCSRVTEGAKGTIAAGLVPLCVRKLVAEDQSKLKEVIIDTLHWCFTVDPLSGLDCNTIPICVNLLEHNSVKLRAQAARLIFDLTLPLEGKQTSCSEADCIKNLVYLLSDGDSFVRSQAAAALQSIAVITPGKYAVLECNTLDRLVELTDDYNSEVRLNSIKLLSLLAEAPEGKKALYSSLEKLRKKEESDNSKMVRKAASIAIRIITWLP